MSIYSPDLLTTERELVMLLRMRDQAKSKEARVTPERLIAAPNRAATVEHYRSTNR